MGEESSLARGQFWTHLMQLLDCYPQGGVASPNLQSGTGPMYPFHTQSITLNDRQSCTHAVKAPPLIGWPAPVSPGKTSAMPRNQANQWRVGQWGSLQMLSSPGHVLPMLVKIESSLRKASLRSLEKASLGLVCRGSSRDIYAQAHAPCSLGL